MASTFAYIYILNLLITHIISSEGTTRTVTIFAITNLDDVGGESAVGGQWLAIQEINNNSNLLSNYTLRLQVLDTSGDAQQALIAALEIIQYKNTENDIYFPIVLGAPWSSLSTATASVLGAFNMGQISSGATSIALSDTNRYPYFYRTIPSDALQAEGLIILCREFNWTSIAIIYVNDAYGLHLSLGIQELSKLYNIEATSIAVSYEDDVTYFHAAEQIKDLGVYIIILVIHSTARLFADFESEGIVGYPYFYLGVDGWFDTITITEWNAAQETHGFIGTVPWQTDSLDLDVYTNDIQKIVNQSLLKLTNVLNSWNYYYSNGYDEDLYLEIPGITMIYGYDAMYTIAYTMDAIDDKYDFIELIENNINDSVLMEILNEYIINDIDFVGLSGHVIFNQVGDRINGLYSFGNILDNATINYFGYFYQDSNGEIQSKLDVNKIVFPSYFNNKGIIPQSHILIHEEIKSIDYRLYITMFMFLGLSFVIAMVFIILLIYYREIKVIRAASWRMNIIMCIGAILGYIAAVLYGIDEGLVDTKSKLNVLCNLRMWILTISYTLLFMPLFVKTYRLSELFKAILTKKIVKDKKLFIIILICIGIDLLLLIIFISIKPLKRYYFNGDIVNIDQLQNIQYIHGECRFNDDDGLTIYVLIAFWKLCQLLFGIYVALDVSKIKDITNLLTKFDETGIQLLSILFTFIILCIAVPIFAFGPIQNADFYYSVIAISILFIGNIVLFLNLFQRIYAVIIGNQQKYEMSPIQRLENKIKNQLIHYSVVATASDDSKYNQTETATEKDINTHSEMSHL